MDYDMIIFDIDGTLWDVAELTMEAANIAASKVPGVNTVSLDDINSVMGLDLNDTAEKIYSNVDHEKAIETVQLSMKIASDLIEEKGGNIYDGVNDTIICLKEKYKLGLVTNNTDSYAELFLKKSGLTNYFTDYIGTTTYGIKKGEAIKLMVIRNKASNACYVGDIKKDMEAAKEANVDYIHARYGFDKSLISDVYINDIKELKELV